jgi:LmbE family N-acetylglucosaminyl deacetylase
MTPSTQRCLLAVLAHPDDESFGPGGTLALYARRGVAVHLICATRGEVGAVDERLMEGFADLGALRESELRCAASHLGLASVHFLGYRDSGMPGSPDNRHPQALAAAPQEEVVARLVPHLRRLRPQVVITFDPIGGYNHPDHIAIHRAALAAFFAASDPSYSAEGLPPHAPQKLYYSTFSRTFLRTAVQLLRLLRRDPRRFGRNADIDLAEVARQDFPIHARVDVTSVLDIKSRASACHASQGGGPPSGMTGVLMRLTGSKEVFMRAFPPAPARLRESDLFEGVSTD